MQIVKSDYFTFRFCLKKKVVAFCLYSVFQRCSRLNVCVVFVGVGWYTGKIADCFSPFSAKRMQLSFLDAVTSFHSSQNPTLGTASAVYKPSKMSPPSTCHYKSRRVGEVGCCSWLQEWRTTCSLSSKTGKYRCAVKVQRRWKWNYCK